MGRSDMRCDGCSQSLDRRLRSHIKLGPVVHDHIWQQLAACDCECLCFQCMQQRARQRLRVLALADLLPCQWNLIGQPSSWFDLFLQDVK
jgi:hypothetical protein